MKNNLKYARAIWWIKRDLRLVDNPALSLALAQAEAVLPVFVFEPDWLNAPETSALHLDAVLQALADLRTRLHKRGVPLVILQGNLQDSLEQVLAAWPFEAVYSHQETGLSWTQARNLQVADWLQRRGLAWHQARQSGVFTDLVNRDEHEQRWQAWMQSPLLPIPELVPIAAEALGELPTTLPQLQELGFELLALQGLQEVTERMAQRSLQSFFGQRLAEYASNWQAPSVSAQHSSRLSVHLAWGTLSPRQAYQRAQALLELSAQKQGLEQGLQLWPQQAEAVKGFLDRLYWRDHFNQRLESEPEMEFRAIHPAYRQLAYCETERERRLQAWCQGRTGYPLVDAAMRCLNQTGFVNSHLRALLVSFACHVLQLHWRWVLPHLARVSRDYDPGILLNQLQMQAGVVGINSLRVLSPLRQQMLLDPELDFVRCWLPEIAPQLSLERIIRNQLASAAYPTRIVDFATQARDTRTRIYALQKRYRNSVLTKEVLRKHASRRPRRNPRRSEQPQLQRA